jgi:uncharacterized membrane protein YfcA
MQDIACGLPRIADFYALRWIRFLSFFTCVVEKAVDRYAVTMVHFPVSGVEVNPLIALLAAFAVSALTTPAGVSGAFLLLFQVSVLGFDSPAVGPTNLVYSIFATPGGVYRYVREGRVVWPLAWAVILGTLPGVFVGPLLRVTLLSDPDVFEVFVGLVLLYFGNRLFYEIIRASESAPQTLYQRHEVHTGMRLRRSARHALARALKVKPSGLR